MITTLVTQLQSLLGKSFVLGSVFPVLLTAALNSVLLYRTSDGFRRWVGDYAAATTGLVVLQAALIALALALVSLVVASLRDTMREALAGGWPEPFAMPFVKHQQERLKTLEDEILKLRRVRRALKGSRKGWLDRLVAARQEGLGAVGRSYARPEESCLDELEETCLNQHLIDPEKLGAAVLETEERLKANSLEKRTLESMELDSDQMKLVALIDSAIQQYEIEWARKLLERNRRFGTGEVQPTALPVKA